MIDDEKLQELLAKASSLYHSGQYQGAIAAWKEALGVDPNSQKAKEGIRMATLLAGDFGAETAATDEPAAPADGGEELSGLQDEEAEARLDVGVARLKQLIAERKFEEAIDGSKSLLPLEKEPGEVQRLLDEAQQGFESAPFVLEHLTLSRELLAQERFQEAEAECKKVFALDQEHPEARELLKNIRGRMQANLKKAASQLGGMTVKLSLPEVLATAKNAPAAGKAPPASKPAAAGKPQAADKASAADPAFSERPPLDGESPPDAVPSADAGSAGALDAGLDALDLSAFELPGENAANQEEVAARAALESAFERSDAAVGGSPAADPAFSERPPIDGEPEPATPPAPGKAAAHAPPIPGLEEEIVLEAKTVKPPTQRSVIPSVTAATAAAGRTAATAAAPPAKAGSAPGAAGGSKPAGTAAKGGKPAPPPAAPAPIDEAAAWETELTQLNIKEGERSLLKGTAAAKVKGRPAPKEQDADLMALLDADPLAGTDLAAEPITSIPLAGAPAAGGGPATEHGGASKTRPEKAPADATTTQEEAGKGTRQKPGRARPPAPASRPGSSSWVGIVVILLLVVAVGGAAGWIYLHPEFLNQNLGRLLGRSQPAAPPAGSSPDVQPDHGPIPTPIGASGRQQPPQSESGAGVAPAPAPPSPAGATPPAATGAAAAGIGAPPAGLASPPSPAPIKPSEAPPISPEEARRRVTAYTSDGTRLMQAGKWREARAKFNAVLALDPVNFHVKDLLDQVQAKIDDETHLTDEFESARKMFNEKDYEGALRKLYRLPQDRGLGDMTLFIRNAWFDWAVLLMKGGNATEALTKLNEALTVDPDDADAIKLQEVAEKYSARAKDRVYFAFTDTLKLRAIDQR